MTATPTVTAEATLEEVVALEQVEASLLDRGRAIFGVSGRFEYGPLRDALRTSGLSLRPAIALGGLGGVALLPLVILGLLGEAMETSFGGYTTQLELIVCAAFVGGLAAAAWRIDRLRSQATAPATAALLCAVAITAASYGTFYALLVALAVAGIAGGVAQSLTLPRLYDMYPPEVRGRVTAIYVGGIVAAVASVATGLAISDTIGLSWRVVLLAVGLLSIVGSVLGRLVPDARRGEWDERPLADEAHRAEGGLATDVELDAIGVNLPEHFRRVLVAASSGPLLLVAFAFGLFADTGRRYAAALLRDGALVPLVTWHRLWAVAWFCGLLGVVYAGRRAEIAYRASPARLLQLVSWLGTLTAAAIALVAVSGDNRVLASVFLCVVAAALAAELASAVFAVVSLTAPTRRAYAAVLFGVALALGVQFGGFLVDSIGSRFGAAWGLVTIAAVVLAVSRRVTAVLQSADQDLDAVVTSIVEEESLRAVVSQGKHVPLLACRGVDFAYGQLQVLFGVDFTVDDGEMVALLGTNGAGKSTLLRVISGLGLPTAGSVRLRGADISYAGTDRRVQLGISQIPGGKAVFGPMTVAENLAVYGFAHGRDRSAVARGVDATFEAFPRLAERRNQLASTLSGGEQQMLALGKAFILRPQLLLIDELSLGLAPIIVSDLLQMVRRINQTGTAVVLVEQSVNIALSLVHHAYFMEKGQIRFDGPAADLIERPDLLRSVFLEGVASAVAERV